MTGVVNLRKKWKPEYQSRYGVNLTGDTAQRELYLPAAGRYAIAIADSRIALSRATGACPIDRSAMSSKGRSRHSANARPS